MNVSFAVKLTVAAGVLALLCGCGQSSSTPSLMGADQKHPSQWLVAHRAAYRTQAAQCRGCHGEINDPSGGITKICCTSTSFQGMTCHFQGHLPRTVPHVMPFADPALHGTAAKADLTYCKPCHSQTFSDGTIRFNEPIGLLKAGCEDCHTAGAAHPPVDKLPGYGSGWSGHTTAGNLAVACTMCHGATFGGGAGPACSTCHKLLAPGQYPNPSTGISCGSCHGTPPDGNTFPNIAGPHAVHYALAGVNGVCRTCHDGGGSGTPVHANYSSVTVRILSSYQSESGGTPNFDRSTKTCRNISCHGGIQTPNWYSGVINVNVDNLDELGCRQCHAFNTAQYNSYHSGHHYLHVRDLGFGATVGLFCTSCHDVDKLKVHHFAALSTPQFDGAPSSTLRDDLQYVPGATAGTGSCTPQNNGTNFPIPGCHATKAW